MNTRMVHSAPESARLATDGLSEEQRLFFSEHGWLVLESVIDEAECRRYIEKIDAAVAALKPNISGQLTNLRSPAQYDAFFLEALRIPGLLEANRQLIGTPRIRLLEQIVHVTEPHPDRHTRRDELLLGLAEEDTNREWHRCFRPRWAVTPADDDPRMVNALVVGSVLFLTPISPEDGSTRFLDGSHRVDGDFSTMDLSALQQTCPAVQPTAPAGSIVIFSESTIHSAVHVVSERTRYGLFNFLSASWIASTWNDPPLTYLNRLADDELRSVLQPGYPADLCERYHRSIWDRNT